MRGAIPRGSPCRRALHPAAASSAHAASYLRVPDSSETALPVCARWPRCGPPAALFAAQVRLAQHPRSVCVQDPAGDVCGRAQGGGLVQGARLGGPPAGGVARQGGEGANGCAAPAAQLVGGDVRSARRGLRERAAVTRAAPSVVSIVVPCVAPRRRPPRRALAPARRPPPRAARRPSS